MKRLILLALFLLGVTISCADRDDDVDMVNIRIKNNTDILFKEVLLVQKDTIYENIGAGEFSEYYEYEQALQEMELTIFTDSTSYDYVPSGVPSDSLPIGLYTYELGLDEDGGVTFAFRIDY